ncbi:MAG: 30S ribosomal protein S17 [Deltaproteobacteria bacterium RIFCSPLOWO2_12_FULL_40_28]|nr:MAG: 30S ribosomal protein S17 [Deltaproteobacteria bacterium RIFCSPHIGHO2_02_FULL_40_28]OGQ19000.1 MAG: 30S ribosomal protein S17 [Deltaproteobacteria bacterium RIFCSPHIGHO2_12_FULL_40_32]OGQ39543.1 MAG: 30S ribosomal protein S17 [Deltaproteobacteria bacterium RIFCSPLOWO2_02_FULL_40_36]OGQ53433.1 MAG: 30S ribosomal protein S17 [Deltaproteobacteria bacterium RIFCSPLOWO2_12_FULL_40_28]
MLGFKRILNGVVVGNKMDKTAVVEVSRRVRHSVFEKYFTKRKKYKAHDGKNECEIGDQVEIKECPPLSREKRWVVVKILEKGFQE